MPPPGDPDPRPDIPRSQVVGTSIGMVEGWLEDAGRKGLSIQQQGLQTPRMQEHIIADEQEPGSRAEGKGRIEAGEELMLVIQMDNEGAIRPANGDRVVRGGVIQQDEGAGLIWAHDQGSQTAIQGGFAIVAQDSYCERIHAERVSSM